MYVESIPIGCICVWKDRSWYIYIINVEFSQRVVCFHDNQYLVSLSMYDEDLVLTIFNEEAYMTFKSIFNKDLNLF